MQPPNRYDGVVRQLAKLPDVVDRLLRAHVPTPDGFCAASSCGRPGYGTPATRYPCSMALVALAARDWRRQHIPTQREP